MQKNNIYIFFGIFLVSIIIIPSMGQTFAIPTTLDYKEYTDDDNRFTIEYPDDWVLADTHADAIIGFDDKYDWRTNFQIFFIEDDTLDNRSDSKVLRAMERNHWETCNDETFADGTRKCSDFEVVNSDVFYTNDNKKVYFVKETYTMEFSDYLPGQEHSFVGIVGLIYDGDHSWEMNVESYEQVADAHYDKIIHMMKSFSVESTSTTHSTVLTLDPIPSKLKVGDNTRFSGTLKTTDGNIVQGANITIKSTKLGVLYTIKTDNNGKFATNFEVPIGWSGLSHELFVIYDDSCDYSAFACSDYNIKTGEYDNYNSKSQLRSVTIISSTPTPTPEPTPPVSNTPSKVAVPAWTKNIFLWYGEDKVLDDELINALKFLIEEKILAVPTSSPSVIKDTTPNNPLYKTFTNEKYDFTLQYPVDWSLSQLGQSTAETVQLAHIWYDGGMSRTQFKEVGPIDIWISLDHYFSETRAETYYDSPGVISLWWKQWCNSFNFWEDDRICRDLNVDVKIITKDGNKQYHILSDYTFEYEDGTIQERKDLEARLFIIDSSFEVTAKANAEDWEIYKDDIYSMIDSVQTTSTHTISNENGFLRLISNVYELPQRGATDLTYSSNIDLFGQFSEKVVGSVTIKVTKSDGKIEQENIRMKRDGISFNHKYIVKSDFPIGKYQITVNTTSDIQLGPISFTAIPANPENQICGGAGWENLEKYGGDIPASGYCRTINTPVLEKQVETKEIPAWSKNIFLWYGQGQVSEDEIVNALQFLINENILSIENRK